MDRSIDSSFISYEVYSSLSPKPIQVRTGQTETTSSGNFENKQNIILENNTNNSSTAMDDILLNEDESDNIPVYFQMPEPDSAQNSMNPEVQSTIDSQTTDPNPKSQINPIKNKESFKDLMDVVTVFKCKFCPFSCAWKSGLLSHIRSFHSEPVQTNPSLTLDINLALMEAKKTNYSSSVQEKDIYLCGQCSKGFTLLLECHKHIQMVHQTGTQVPQLSNDLNLKKPVIVKPVIYKTSVLNKKSKLLETGEEFKDDQSDKNVEKPYKCNQKGCGYRFSTLAKLDYHLKCHNRDEQPFCCPECGIRSEYWRVTVIHLWNKHQIDLDLLACDFDACKYKTHSLFKLTNHQRIHSDKREFICETCQKAFKQLGQLRNHQIIHRDRKNSNEKHWYSKQECDICQRVFADAKCLKKHIQSVHNKIKTFVCNVCGHRTSRKAMLQLHMRQHTGEKPFKCDLCEYSTGDHNSLRRHKMRHNNEKKYQCPHCPYACIQAISYKVHLKNRHPNLQGLYACNLCKFRSVSKENYLNHMGDHKRGEIPLQDQTEEIENPEDDLTPFNLPEDTLQQLETVLPGNKITAKLIYSCLNALTKEGGLSNLPTGVTTSCSSDGTQTITIQLPSGTVNSLASQNEMENEQFYCTIEQQQPLNSEMNLIEENSELIDANTFISNIEDMDLSTN